MNHNRKLSVLFGVAAALLLATTATAQVQRAPVSVRLTNGLDAGPSGDNTGPGAEQATLVQSVVDGHHYITTVWMSSQVGNGDRPYQCKCATTELDPLQGPRTVAGPTQITALNGDRPCNHPHMDINPLTNQILLSYGSTNGSNNVQPYVQGLDVMCNVTTNKIRIGNNNGNDGAPWVQVVNPATGLFQVGYLENNQRSRAVGVSLPAGATALTRGNDGNHSVGGNVLYNKTIVGTANIGRPSIARVSDTSTIFCSSNGDNRPPEFGVACAAVDALTGDKTWDNNTCTPARGNNTQGSCLIAQSHPNANPPTYMNQPIVALGENGRFYVQVEQSNGPPNNNNNNARGATTTMLYTLLPNATGPSIQGHVESIGLNQVHATTCTGKYGQDAKVHVAVVDSSITGSGIGAVQLEKFDITGQTLTQVGNPLALSGYPADSGYLANQDGQNPNDQGRDFMRCIGDIANPGFGVANGFMPTVQSFFAIPFAGCADDQGAACDPDVNPNNPEKNSLFLSLLPAEEPAPAPIVTHDLSVVVDGQGTGKVFSSPLGVDGCDSGATCTATFDEGTNITLTALAGEGSIFSGWQGACTGTGGCVVAMSQAQQVTATFDVGGVIVNDPVGLIVSVLGQGDGSVTSDPAGITCTGGTCASNFDRNSSVTLTATPGAGSKFTGWNGDCSGTEPCVLTLSAARNVTAVFDLDPNAPDGGDNGNGNGGDVTKAPGASSTGFNCASSGSSPSAYAMLALVAGGLLFLRRRRSVLTGAASAAVAVGLVASLTACPAAAPTPVIDAFVADQPTVAAGTPVQLSYQVHDAEAVTISVLAGVDVLPFSDQLSGTIFTPPVTVPTTFVITAFGPALAGRAPIQSTKTVSVTVGDPANPTPSEGEGEGENNVAVHAQILSFGPSATNVTTGDSVTLTWQTSNAASGVILANDAVLTTITASDLTTGTFGTTPDASAVYTLSLSGSDGQLVTSTTAVNVSPPGVGPLTAEAMFSSNVEPILQSKCGVCHESGNASGYPDLFGTSSPDTYYQRVTADSRFIPAVPEDSLLLLKGEHTGPAFLPAEAQQVTAWLVQEAGERGTGSTGPTDPGPTGNFQPTTLAEALTRFGACMDRQVWDNTVGQGNNTRIAQQNTTQGKCMGCHSSGTAGAFLSASSGDTFDMNRTRPYVLKLVLSTANVDGSFKDLVAARRFEKKGSEGGDHPSYQLTQARLDAINSFVDQTLTSYHDYTQACNNP